jgi:hypothetical protein
MERYAKTASRIFPRQVFIKTSINLFLNSQEEHMSQTEGLGPQSPISSLQGIKGINREVLENSDLTSDVSSTCFKKIKQWAELEKYPRSLETRKVSYKPGSAIPPSVKKVLNLLSEG